jgi:hypothetical protein
MSRTRELKRIAKDPLHQQILEALGRHLDPQVFEACMADLLRDVFPGIVPVPGGDDAGMDAAIADGKGEPYPLVCTTGEDVAGNLRSSLDAFLARGLSSRKVALATSRALTPRETRELFNLAKEKGFTLLQIFERSALASLLYRDTTWCKRLLGLTGSPSALSIIPLSRRPQVDIELKGRDEDAEWLRSTSGDRVVLGFPGSGKTYLFSSLIRSGWPALFLVGDDETDIANAIRDQNPGIVIVDDAHVAPDRLVRLRRLRDEIHGKFEIVASSWPGDTADVIESLGGLPESRIHALGPLTRAQIVEIFQDLDVRPRDEILRDLVNQAGNKPGLAVTIALLWRQGEWQRILDGSVLSRTLLAVFRGGEIAAVLAVFSLGGRLGMGLEAVAQFLEIPSRDILKIASDLAAGGVLSESLAVNPRVLRSALLRQIFFTGSPIRLDYRKLLPLVPSFAESVGEILMARAYGAVIAPDELHDLVLRTNSLQAWSILATLNEPEAQWVLDNFPDDILKLAANLLHQIPGGVISRIFERAAEIVNSGSSSPQKSMEVLLDWVQDYWAGAEEWIHRRRLVAKAAKKFLLEGGEREVGVHGVCIALSPNRRGDSLDPDRGDVLSEWRGLLPSETLRQIEPIWDEAKEAIQVLDAASWHQLTGILWDWIHTRSARSREEAAEKRGLMHEFATRVVRDLAPLSQGSPGLQGDFARLAIEVDISLELTQDSTFLLLCPSRVSNDERAAQGEQVKALAAEWAQGDPEAIARQIAFYVKEAQKRSYPGFSNIWEFCLTLAEEAHEPEKWFDAFLTQDLPGDLISPFLVRIVGDQREGWDSLLARCLNIDLFKWTAARLVLELENSPLSLFEKVLNEFDDLAALVEQRCQNMGVPISTVGLLLRHAQWEIALAAAVGEWWAEPKAEVRKEILPNWRSAILRSKTEEYPDTERNMGVQYLLGCILSSDSNLALEWLEARLRDPDLPRYFREDSPFAHALRSLGKDQRLAFLQDLEPFPIVDAMIPLLIQGDVDVYEELLSRKRLSDYHLRPLRGLPQRAWSKLALAALRVGHEPAQIAGAAFGTSHTVVGSGIEYWHKWDLAFVEVGREKPPELQEISQYGREIVQRKLQEAKGMEEYIDRNGLVGGLIPLRTGH